MPEVGPTSRTESYPSLTARENWGLYAAGIAVEAAFIIGLTVLGFLLAIIAQVIWP